MHKGHSLGYVVEGQTDKGGVRVVYTGDTRPTAGTVAVSRSVDLLVHEATFCEDERDRARSTCHSTAAEAAAVARDGLVVEV